MKNFDINYRQLFESIPGLYLILDPQLTIVEVSNTYANATMTKRDEILGRHLFEVFPDNPDDESADGVSKLKASLDYVQKYKKAHTMTVQKYDIRRPDGSFEVRYWSPINTPVLDDDKQLTYIVHKVEDVSEFVLLEDEKTKNEKLATGLRHQMDEMKIEIILRSKEIEQMNQDLEQKVKDRTDELLKNELRFRALIENNFDIITLNDEKGIASYQSPSAERILGWTLEERKTNPGFSFVHPDDQERLKLLFQEVLANPTKSIHNSHRLKHKDGHYIWTEGILTNHLQTPGINAIVSNFRDITERKKDEEKIQLLNESLEQKVIERTLEIENQIKQFKESEEKFEKAFQASAAAISIIRISDSTFLDVNNAFIKMSGYQKNEIIGRTSVDIGLIVDIDKREEVWKEIKNENKGKKNENKGIRNVEMQVKNKDGVIYHVLSSIEIFSMNGENTAIGISYDITDRIEAEQQLAAVNKELEAFTYSISHDLRAPLRAINGYAEILLEDYSGKLDDEAERWLNNIKHYATKMGTLIDDLLSFSRLGRKDLQRVSIDLNELVEGVMMDLDKSISHHAEIKTGTLHKIEADYGLIHQVIFNLISNAIKYSSLLEKPVVEINSQQKQGEIIFSVKDNGAGFDMKYVHKLFGVFNRLHTQEEFEGTGVGLAIVQRIINKHGGRVWAEGKINVGAQFHFSIPNKKQK